MESDPNVSTATKSREQPAGNAFRYPCVGTGHVIHGIPTQILPDPKHFWPYGAISNCGKAFRTYFAVQDVQKELDSENSEDLNLVATLELPSDGFHQWRLYGKVIWIVSRYIASLARLLIQWPSYRTSHSNVGGWDLIPWQAFVQWTGRRYRHLPVPVRLHHIRIATVHQRLDFQSQAFDDVRFVFQLS